MTFNYVLNKIKNPDDIKDIKASYEYANSKLSGIMRKMEIRKYLIVLR